MISFFKWVKGFFTGVVVVQGQQGLPGAIGLTGPKGDSPSKEEIKAAIHEVLAERENKAFWDAQILNPKGDKP